MDKKELKNRASRLSYYLKFIQADLDYLDDRDIALPLHLLYLLPAGIGDWPEIAKQHEHWFGDLEIKKKKSAPTYMKIGDRTVETKEFLRAIELQKRLRTFLSKILNEKWDTFELLPRAKIVLSKETTTHVELGLKEAVDMSSMPRSFQIQHFPIGKGDPPLDIAVLNFASLLNGLPVDSIRRCEECQRYFINLSKRKKIFCDIKCAWKNHARLAREEVKKHPQRLKAYRIKQKALMWHHYEKRVKAENPNAKIKRRVIYAALRKPEEEKR